MNDEVISSNGYCISVDDYVAYNRSGEVHLGIVQKVVVKWIAATRYYPARFCGYVDVKHSTDETVSRVRNPASIATINTAMERHDEHP